LCELISWEVDISFDISALSLIEMVVALDVSHSITSMSVRSWRALYMEIIENDCIIEQTKCTLGHTFIGELKE